MAFDQNVVSSLASSKVVLRMSIFARACKNFLQITNDAGSTTRISLASALEQGIGQMSTDDVTKSITADDVAELAGVSRWTVNRAYKKDASISSKSLEKVIAAATQLGYAPDLLASSLASDKSNLVAVLMDDFSNPYQQVLLEHLSRVLRTQGSDTLLVNALDDDDASIALLTASQRRVDAAVLIGARFNDAVLETALGARKARKLIQLGRRSSDPNTVSICCDDEAAMKDIMVHILKRGYRNPLFLSGPETTSILLKRKEGFLAHWARETGRPMDCVHAPGYNPQVAYKHMAEWLGKFDANNRPDVLICENDSLALGAMDAIRHELGLRVPQDIAVTGFDDTPQAENPNYDLTSYRQPLPDMMAALVAVLQGQASGPDLAQFRGTLIARGSA